MTAIQRTSVLSEFTCLGEKCEDTCCQNWSMQVDEATLALYRKEAPELMDAVEQSQDSPQHQSWIMRKDPQTRLCVKLEGGLCGIHKNRGDRFLSDACHFYPRVTRRLGEEVVMTATMSCPEITRLALAADQPCVLTDATVERLPHAMKDYLPEGLKSDEALAIHKAFLQATEDSGSTAEQIFLRISSTSRSLARIDIKSWPAMVPFYLSHADTRIPSAETHNADPFNLLHALCGLIVAAHKPPSERLQQTIADMEKAMMVMLDWKNVQIHADENSLSAYRNLQELWRKEAAVFYEPVLRRWLQMQMSMALYPYSGLGKTLPERVTIIGVRLATIKLALLCCHSINGGVVSQDIVIRVLQSLSRILDHLADPDFSVQIYTETGWIKESRMRGLLEN